MTVETHLAAHAAHLRDKDLPDDASTAFGRLFLDTAGAMLAGFADTECRTIAEVSTNWGGLAAASVVGSQTRVPSPSAAFANGVYAHWCEWDDTHDPSHVHCSAVIFPALGATAEAMIAEGKEASGDFAAAAVAAFDIACRIGALLRPHSHRGWMPTGSGGTIGAAAGAARLLGLDEKGTLSAMGIAAAGAGLFRQALTDTVNGKNILAGVAAQKAVEAAFLARAGVTGAPNFLTGDYGLQNLHANGKGNADAAAEGLGDRFSITEVSIKPYPCCRSTHPILDVVFDFIGEDPGAAEATESVHVMAPQGIHERCGAPFRAGDNPRVSAQFSIPYTVALALRRGHIAPADFRDRSVLSDAAGVLDLVARVGVEAIPLAPGPDDPIGPVTVRFTLADGRVIEKTAGPLKGSPEAPLSDAEERRKLEIAVAGVLPRRLLDALVAAIGEGNLTQTMAVLRQAETLK